MDGALVCSYLSGHHLPGSELDLYASNRVQLRIQLFGRIMDLLDAQLGACRTMASLENASKACPCYRLNQFKNMGGV